MVKKSKILHISDGIGGILCDGSFTNETQNNHPTPNPVATEEQKNAVSNPDYFSNSNVLAEIEGFCSDCVEEVRSSYPDRGQKNSIHLYKVSQKPNDFSYCGIGSKLLMNKNNSLVDPRLLNKDSEPRSRRIPKSKNLCDNCIDGYPDDIKERLYPI